MHDESPVAHDLYAGTSLQRVVPDLARAAQTGTCKLDGCDGIVVGAVADRAYVGRTK